MVEIQQALLIVRAGIDRSPVLPVALPASKHQRIKMGKARLLAFAPLLAAACPHILFSASLNAVKHVKSMTVSV